MTSIENIALKVVNSMDIQVSSTLGDSRTNNYHLGINKLNVITKYPSWFYLQYSSEIQLKVNDIIKKNFDKIIQQRIYEILSKDN